MEKFQEAEPFHKHDLESSTINDKTTEHRSKKIFPYVATAVANLAAFSVGVVFSWTSPVLPKLNGSVDPANNPLGRNITHTEEALIAGLVSLSGIFGPWLAGPIANRIGRKRALLLAVAPMVVAYLITAFARTIALFYFARLLMGVSASSIYAVIPMYVGEIAQDHNRGTLGCFLGIFFTSGLLFSFAVGPFVSVFGFSVACLVPLFLFVPIFSVFMPETPQFLAYVGDEERLKLSLTKLRNKEQVHKEMAELMEGARSRNHTKSNLKDLYRDRGLRKALIICFVLVGMEQASGVRAILAYMQTIFASTGSQLDPRIPPIIIGVIQVLTTTLTTFLVDRVGRRQLLLYSTAGTCISLVALGVYFNLQIQSIWWLPMVSLILFVVTFCMGLGPLPWAIAGEMFPQEVRSIAVTLNSMMCFVVAFVVTVLFRVLHNVFGIDRWFWIFAAICAGGWVFMYKMVPETKGKSQQEIRKMLLQ